MVSILFKTAFSCVFCVLSTCIKELCESVYSIRINIRFGNAYRIYILISNLKDLHQHSSVTSCTEVLTIIYGSIFSGMYGIPQIILPVFDKLVLKFIVWPFLADTL